MNFLKLDFGQVLKGSYLNESFLLLETYLEKTKLIGKKYLISCALPKTEDDANLFQVDAHFLHRLKTSKTFCVPDRFK